MFVTPGFCASSLKGCGRLSAGAPAITLFFPVPSYFCLDAPPSCPPPPYSHRSPSDGSPSPTLASFLFLCRLPFSFSFFFPFFFLSFRLMFLRITHSPRSTKTKKEVYETVSLTSLTPFFLFLSFFLFTSYYPRTAPPASSAS